MRVPARAGEGADTSTICLSTIGGDRSEDGMHGANDVELDNNAPVNTFFSECCGCVDTLKL